MADNPNGLFLWPEFSVILKKLNEKNFAGAKQWITNCFDEWNIPDAVRYRQTGKKSDTPSIVFDQAPRANLLATSSYDWFIGSLDEQDITGGFIPRWLIVKLGKPTKLVPIPPPTDSRLIAPLADRLRQPSELEGEADLSLVLGMYEDWYGETNKRFSEESNQALAKPFFNRMRTNILKLAVVFEVSQSGTLKMTPVAMTRAIGFAGRIEQTIFELLPTGLNREGSEVDKIAERVKSAGPEGLSQSDLTKAFQSMRGMDRKGRIHTLQEGGTIQRFFRTTAGRNAVIYVHRDFVDEHKSLLPDDMQLN